MINSLRKRQLAEGEKDKRIASAFVCIEITKIQGSCQIQIWSFASPLVSIQKDWGGMTDYVERAHIITDAHLLFEVLDVGEHFCIAFMQMLKTKKYMDCFCQILDEEKIPYRIHGVFKNHLPISKAESAPMV